MSRSAASALGEIIRRQREMAELSMRQFAELAGISNPYLSQIERGLRAPSEQVLEQVILAPHAVKRLIEPSEVAEVVAFLAGPGGSAFTGVPVTMDQGWSAR